MIALNLTATTAEQTIIKNYLENNVSEVLADKINDGIKIIKDGKTLISKKTLETFLAYACEEARKLAEKGARAAAVKSDTVFGWAIHYFEEDSIEGTLYNEDGTEYKPPKPVIKNKPATQTLASVTPVSIPTSKPKVQFSLFDMLDTKPEEKSTKETEVEADEPEDDESGTEIDETPLDEAEDDEPEQLIQISETKWADKNGVIHEVVEVKNEPVKIQKENAPDALIKLFGDLLIMR